MKTCILTLASLLAGCGMAPDDENGVFTRTIVHRNEDGTERIEITQVTAAQQRAAVAERDRLRQPATNSPVGVARESLTSTATVDGSCLGSSMWTFDGTNLTGNEICFTGTWPSVAYLDNYCRSYAYTRSPNSNVWMRTCVATWRSAVRSYYPGSMPGAWNCCPSVSNPWGYEPFQSMWSQGSTNAAACGQSAYALALGIAGAIEDDSCH